MNMAYCRFRNTLSDFQDCYENWDRIKKGEEPEEYQAQQAILKLCCRIAEDYGDMIPYSEPSDFEGR